MSSFVNISSTTPLQGIASVDCLGKIRHTLDSIYQKIERVVHSVFQTLSLPIQREIASWRQSRHIRELKRGVHKHILEAMQSCVLSSQTASLDTLEEQAKRHAIERVLVKNMVDRGIKPSRELLVQIEQDLDKVLNNPSLLSSLHVIKEKSITEDDLTTSLLSIRKSRESFNIAFVQKSYSEFSLLFQNLQSSLKEGKFSNPTLQMSAVISDLRKLFSSSFYTNYWMCDHFPEITFLQNLALAFYTKKQAQELYTPFGELARRGKTTSKPLPKRFLSSVRKAPRAHLHTSMFSLGYIFQNIGRIMAAVRAFFPFMGKYDSVQQLGNTPCRLFEEHLMIEDKSSSIVSVMTPTPTLGFSLTPEMHLVLQGLENNYFNVIKGLLPPSTPTHWSFCNLQSLNIFMQYKRSQAIMLAQEEYPFSFSAYSLDLNSSIHMDGISDTGSSISQALRAQKKCGSELNEDYKNHLIEHILNRGNFSIKEKKRKPESCYYFPFYNEGEKEKLRTLVKQLADRSFEIAQQSDCLSAAQELLGKDASEKNVQHMAKWIKKAIFRELIHLGLIRGFQLQRAATTPGALLSTAACMESIDRGNKVSNQMLWALADYQDGEADKVVFNTLHGRALVGSSRIMFPSRSLAFSAFILGTQRDEVRAFLQRQIQEFVQISTTGSSVSL